MTDDLVKRLLNAPADGLGTENLCLEAADRIEALTDQLQVSNELGKALEEDAGQLRADNARCREALDNLLEAITANDKFGDRSLTTTGPTANLKWLLEAEEDARAALTGKADT